MKILDLKLHYLDVILTLAPPDGWWIIILEFGSEYLMPGEPAANKRLAILQACPTHLSSIYQQKKVKFITENFCCLLL